MPEEGEAQSHLPCASEPEIGPGKSRKDRKQSEQNAPRLRHASDVGQAVAKINAASCHHRGRLLRRPEANERHFVQERDRNLGEHRSQGENGVKLPFPRDQLVQPGTGRRLEPHVSLQKRARNPEGVIEIRMERLGRIKEKNPAC